MFSQCTSYEVKVLKKNPLFASWNNISRRPDNQGKWEFFNSDENIEQAFIAPPELFLLGATSILNERGWTSNVPCDKSNWASVLWNSHDYDFTLKIFDPVSVVVGNDTRYGFSVGMTMVGKKGLNFLQQTLLLENVGIRIAPYEIEKTCPSLSIVITSKMRNDPNNIILCVMLYGFFHYFLVDKQNITTDIFTSIQDHAMKIGNTCIIDLPTKESELTMSFVSRSILASFLGINKASVDRITSQLLHKDMRAFVQTSFGLLNPEYKEPQTEEERLSNIFDATRGIAELKLFKLCDIVGSEYSVDLYTLLSILETDELISEKLNGYVNSIVKNKKEDPQDFVQTVASFYNARLALRAAYNFQIIIKEAGYSIHEAELNIYLLSLRTAFEVSQYNEKKIFDNVEEYAKRMLQLDQ